MTNGRFAFDSPLGPDALHVKSFTGWEGLSQLFRFQVELLSEGPAIPFDRILGQPVTLHLPLADGNTRYVNGVVSHFAQAEQDTHWTAYQAEVVPWLWFLTLRQDCRIFQDMTVPDMVTSLFEELSFFDYKTVLTGEFTKHEYCVQYQETDFNFVSRLMEKEGLLYFFEHEQDKHTLVIANTSSVHQVCSGQDKARYTRVVGDRKQEDMITAWKMRQELLPGKYAMTDYHWETPDDDLTVQSKSRVPGNGYDAYERFIYPGGYRKKSQGERLLQLRREEEEATHLTIQGESTCRAFTVGYRFDLVGHYRAEVNTAYLLTEIHHKVSSTVGPRSAVAPGVGAYSNTFTCIPVEVPYRSPCQTPTPRIFGPQTAFVVGREDEELFVDKYGRVKVQFLWDRKGKWNERSSCWVRVAQIWAGTQWGALCLPRVVQEVIVEFLDGDPDRPIITGRVYNAEAMPLVELPTYQEWAGLLSNRVGGGACHALLMCDHQSEGKVVLQSYGDMHARTQRNRREWTGNDHDGIIKGNCRKEIGQNSYMKIGQEIVIDAGTELTIKSSGGFIKIDPSGITIQGNIVQINSGGSPGVISDLPVEAERMRSGQVDRMPRRR